MKRCTTLLDRFISQNSDCSMADTRLLLAQKRIMLDGAAADSAQQAVTTFIHVELDGICLQKEDFELVGHAVSSVMLSRSTSAVGKARERRTGRRQFKRVQRGLQRLCCGPSGVAVRARQSLELTDMLRYLAIALSGLGMAGSAGAGELPDPLAAGWKGESVCEKLHEDERLRILRCRFPPNVGHERHYHPPHVGYVISGGSMQVTDADGTRTIDLPDGYVFSNPEGVDWHEALNVGDGESTYLMIEPR